MVNLIIRGADLGSRTSSYLIDRIRAHPRIRTYVSTIVCELAGDDTLTSIVTEQSDRHRTRLDCSALFCFIGADPVSRWLSGLAMDDDGFVLTDSRLPARLARRIAAVPDQRSRRLRSR